MDRSKMRSTTILGLTHKGKAAMGGDGQVSFGDTIMKHRASKVRKLYNDTILVGCAGAAADALALFERLEEKLESFNGNLRRASVELVKEWRTDRYLRKGALILSGEGDLIEPDDGIVAIGSGGPFAMSAARAYVDNGSKLSAKTIVEKSLKIAASICVYTNDQIIVEEL